MDLERNRVLLCWTDREKCSTFDRQIFVSVWGTLRVVSAEDRSCVEECMRSGKLAVEGYKKKLLRLESLLTKRVQARSRGGRWCWALKLQGPGKIKRREVVLDPVVSPEEIMSREVELGCESWTSVFASSCYSTAVQRTLSL